MLLRESQNLLGYAPGFGSGKPHHSDPRPPWRRGDSDDRVVQLQVEAFSGGAREDEIAAASGPEPMAYRPGTLPLDDVDRRRRFRCEPRVRFAT